MLDQPQETPGGQQPRTDPHSWQPSLICSERKIATFVPSRKCTLKAALFRFVCWCRSFKSDREKCLFSWCIKYLRKHPKFCQFCVRMRLIEPRLQMNNYFVFKQVNTWRLVWMDGENPETTKAFHLFLWATWIMCHSWSRSGLGRKTATDSLHLTSELNTSKLKMWNFDASVTSCPDTAEKVPDHTSLTPANADQARGAAETPVKRDVEMVVGQRRKWRSLMRQQESCERKRCFNEKRKRSFVMRWFLTNKETTVLAWWQIWFVSLCSRHL